MPDGSIRELYKQLRTAERLTAEHQELIWAIEELEREALPFRRFQGRKQLPLLKERDRTRLMELHRRIGAKAEALLAGNDRPAVKEMVRKLEALSAHNYRALLEYDPVKKPMTLEAIEENSRTLTLHLGAGEDGAEKWGDALSDRRPLSFYDSKGNKINGMFTKKNELQIIQGFHSALEKAEADCAPADRETAKAIFQTLRESLSDPVKMRKVVNDEMLPITDDPLTNLCSLLRLAVMNDPKGKGTRMDPVALLISLNRILPPELAEKFSIETAQALASRLDEIRITTVVHVRDAKIPDGSRRDNRNAAMSTVADLLGMPSVVARSRPMKLIGPDGSETEGTFMELAKGLDLHNLNSEAEQLGRESLEEGYGKAMRDIANLQILDYLCGNIDRHMANFSYQFDKDRNFTGVQGFDNDSSFGTVVPEGRNGVNRLVGIKDMRAIPRKTYERLMQLTPATLKYALRGYGLSEEELNAAVARLNNLQTELKKEKDFYQEHDRRDRSRPLLDDHVRILEDDEWTDYEIEDYYVSDKINSKNEHVTYENTFTLAIKGVKEMPTRYRKQEKAFQDLSKTIAVGIRNRALSSTPGREQKKAAELGKLLDKRSWWGFSSENYRRMERAVEAYTNYQKQLGARLKAAGSEDAKRRADYVRTQEAVVTQADLERMQQLSERMRQAAQTYLDGKLVNGVLPANASEYTKKRVRIARDVLSYGEQGAQLRPEEQRKAQANEAEAQASQTRRQQTKEQEREEAQELRLQSL